MRCIISETQELKELCYHDTDGYDCTLGTLDLANAFDDGSFTPAGEDGTYRVSQYVHDWWSEYFAAAQADQEELRILKITYDPARIDEIVGASFCNEFDFGAHHRSWQSVFEHVRKNLDPIPQTNLARLRKINRLSQSQLAAGAGLSLHYITNIEQCRRSISGVSLGIAARLASVLGIHAEDLLDSSVGQEVSDDH